MTQRLFSFLSILGGIYAVSNKKSTVLSASFSEACCFLFFFKIISKCQKIFTLLTEIKKFAEPKAILFESCLFSSPFCFHLTTFIVVFLANG